MRRILAILFLALTAPLLAQTETRPAKPADLAEALESLPAEAKTATYAPTKEVKGEKTLLSDYVAVDKDGKPHLHKNRNRTPEEFEQNKYLDCTTFASPVLYRMVKGSFSGFKQKNFNGYGDATANSLKMTDHREIAATSFLENANDETWREHNTGIYYFDLRLRRSADKPDIGHVGFLEISAEGTRFTHMTERNEGPGWSVEDDFEAFVSTWQNAEKRAATRNATTVHLYAIRVPAEESKR